MMVPAKGKAGAEAKGKTDPNKESSSSQGSQSAPPELTGRWDFSRLFEVAAHPDIVKDAKQSADEAERVAKDAVLLAAAKGATRNAIKAAAKAPEATVLTKADMGKFVPKPMSHEEIRLWLQSFNAGPYALLKYKGDVPYKETQNYVPRVLKAYEQDLPDTYDEEVNKAATKYGLDPQMIKAIMKTESDFNKETVSHAGARGLMQVMPVVWQDIEKKYGMGWDYSTEVFEPAKNIEVACAYLAWLRYDFLPRHFEAYELDPEAPDVLVRDRDRGVPDRPTPRLVANVSGYSDDVNMEVASASVDQVMELKPTANAKVESENKTKKSEVKAESEKKIQEIRPRVEISDSDSDRVVKKSTSDGKTRVVKPGAGKAVSLSVGKTGKVTATGKSRGNEDEDIKTRKRPAVAKATSKEEKETQGG